MKYYFYIFLFLSFSCSDTTQIVEEGDPIFHTTDPSRLYFQNTRSHHYDAVTQQATKIDHYQLKSWKMKPLLYPLIANNWLSEEAYILMHASEDLALPWRVKGNDDEILELSSSDRKEHYTFCLNIYRSLKSAEELSVQNKDGTWMPIWETPQDKKQFETTLRDYFRLIEKI